MNQDKLDELNKFDDKDQLDDLLMNIQDVHSIWTFKISIQDDLSRWTVQRNIRDEHSRWTS